jgi:sugar phosphate permease
MDQNSEQGSSPYKWVVLAMGMLAYVMSLIPRFAWPPLVPELAPLLKINMTEAGSYMTAFYIGYVITQVPAGLLGDRFGVKGILAMTLVVQGLATLLFGSISTFSTGFALRVLSGLSGGCVYASCFKLVMQWFAPSQRGLAFGLLMSTPSLGLALANFLVPNINKIWGWSMVFRSIGIFAILCAPVAFILTKERVVAGPAGGPRPGFVDGLKTILKDRNILILCLAGITYLATYNGFVSWANTYLKTVIELDLVMAGYVMTFLAMVGIILSPLAGYVAGKTGKGTAMLLGCLVLLAAGIVMFGRVSTLPAIWALAFVIGLGFSIGSPMLSFVVSSYTPQKYAATTGGVTSFCWQFGSLLAPIVTGWSVDFTGSFGAVWILLSVLCLVGLALVLLVRKPSQAA